ncbi:CLUMA_CG004188, isoform A [Clunio marinus]|uniref:CLUMA_CG004188, isoform A n=1 Tax=Clunio marinus TaxID=568069 RepID=A0A1J1HVF1_9DIPT|nr:CLUMA_CG004188, isoform A [Clunio marinus]
MENSLAFYCLIGTLLTAISEHEITIQYSKTWNNALGITRQSMNLLQENEVIYSKGHCPVELSPCDKK